MSSNKGRKITPGFTEGTDFKHCNALRIFLLSVIKSSYANDCIMTDQASGYFRIISMTENYMTRTENLFYSSS